MGSERADYRVGASLFCRGIGLIYLVALVSWWLQAGLLIGENGLVPIQPLLDFLDQRWETTGQGSRWNVPTLFWLTGGSDAAIHGLFIFGVVLAILVVAGLGQGPALIGLFVIYLSFVNTGDIFLRYQWDILLLEAGFLAIFLSSWRWWEKFREPPRLTIRRWIALGLAWFLIGKLMFLSGWVKLAWASEMQPEWWPDHTAMLYHYETQPIPTWTAWFAHQLPVWFQKFSIWPMYFIEIVLPFCILLGNRLRAIAGVGFIFLMILILLTGNYTYFNWLTIIISLPLIADKFWPGKKSIKNGDENTESKKAWVKWTSLGVAAPAFVLLAVLNLQVMASSLHRDRSKSLSPKGLTDFSNKLAPYGVCSSYGLFRTMTTDRPEIILQGSMDGVTWKSYNFKWKPDELDDVPYFVAPHQPRVAWQLWFAGLERRFNVRGSNSRWFRGMLEQLIKGEENVQQLFIENPFPESPPNYLRAKLYLYEFTTFSEKRESGDWWKRVEAGGEYLPVVGRR